MFKQLVLCALFAAAIAEPQVFLPSPAYTETFLAPATTTTTVTKQASSVINAPYYSAYPYAAIPHFIKKRDVISTYAGPAIYPSAPLATTYSTAYYPGNPLLPYAPVPYTAAHLIKKRSPGLIVPSTYVASAPLASTYLSTGPYAATYSTAVLPSTPFVSTYATPHFIKKRSATLSYIATAPLASSYFANAPIASTYVASAPLSTTYSTTFLPGSPIVSAYTAPAHFIKK